MSDKTKEITGSRVEYLKPKTPLLSVSCEGLGFRVELSVLKTRRRYFNKILGQINECEDYQFASASFQPFSIFKKPQRIDSFYDGHTFKGIFLLGVQIGTGKSYEWDGLEDKQAQFAHLKTA